MMAISEYGQLRRLVHNQGQGWRLHRGEREGLYTLCDTTGAIEADGLTSQEVRGLCAGVIGLAQLRQPAKPD